MRRALILVAVLGAALGVPAALAAPRSAEVRVSVGVLFPTQARIQWISDGQSEVEPLPSNYRKIMSADAGTCVRIWPANEERGDGHCVDAGPIRYHCQGVLGCSIQTLGNDKVEIIVSAGRGQGHRGSS